VRVQIFSASKRSFSCEAGAALIFFASFFVSRQKRKWGMGQSPIKQVQGFYPKNSETHALDGIEKLIMLMNNISIRLF